MTGTQTSELLHYLTIIILYKFIMQNKVFTEVELEKLQSLTSAKKSFARSSSDYRGKAGRTGSTGSQQSY